MENKKIRAIGAAVLAAVWGGLALGAWFLPAKETSDAERRELAQMPEADAEAVLDGSFMSDFEDYALDQFPLRDGFRTLKSLAHYYALGFSDNNDIYIAGGSAVKQEYPLDTGSVDYALGRFDHIYEKYLKDSGSAAYMAVVPDKGYYLGGSSGHLIMDYEAMFTQLREGMPWASWIDLTDVLSAESYYRTDTHWRQETLLAAAGRLCQAMGVTGPESGEWTATALERPFYGVYYGQAALPLAADTMYLMESDVLSQCTVTNFETGKTAAVYDLTKLASKDLYEVFLSGSVSLLEIENPSAGTDRELVIFRDSFGSAMAPLLVQDYAKVTLVDIRYLSPELLGKYVDFHGQDVLFLYSTLVLNNSSTIK